MSAGGRDSDDDERNPFISFRRFVDEQMSLMVRTMRNLPSAFPEVRKEIGEAQRDAFDAWKRFNDGYERSMNPERRKTEMRPGEKELQERQQAEKEMQRQHDNERIWCPWIAFDHQPGPNFRRNSSAPGPGSSWQPREAWMRHSTYSPLQLEQDPMLQQSQIEWREAFEDLLRVQQSDTSLPDRTAEAKAKEQQSGEDWLSSLREKHLLRPTGRISKSPFYDEIFAEHLSRRIFEGLSPMFEQTPEESESKQDQSSTELDMYEQFLGRNGEPARIERHQHTHVNEASDYSTGDSEQTRVVSSHSTTEHRYLPDGSVETTKVVRKRFSDGSEEKEETQTIKPPSAPSTPKPSVTEEARKAIEDAQKMDENSTKKEKNGSWFWSS